MTTITNHVTVRRRAVSSWNWTGKVLRKLPPIPDREARRWSWWLLAVAVLGVLLPITVSAITGNISIPHNDSWASSKIAETFANTGTIKLVNWNEMSMIGQAVMLGPLGSSIVNQQVSIAILSLILLYCAYDIMAPSLSTGRAGFGALVIAIWPGFALIATSFMTDIPQITAGFACLALGRRALQRDSPVLFYLALLISFWGTTVREEAVIAPFSVVVYALIRPELRTRLTRKHIGISSGVFVFALLVFLAWRSGLAQANNPPLVDGSLTTVMKRVKTDTPEFIFTLALGVSPAVVLTARPWRWTKGSWWAASLVALLAYMIGLGPGNASFLSGNYLTNNGAYPEVLGAAGGAIRVFGGNTIEAWNDVGAASAVLLAGTLFERWRWKRVEPMVAIFTAISAVAILIFGWIGLGLYDRYFIVLVPCLMMVVLAKRPATVHASVGADPVPAKRRGLWSKTLDGGQVGLAVIATLFVVALSGLTAANSFSFDIARWHLGEQLVRTTGVPADKIDAGIEWLGTHLSTPVISTPGHLLNGVNFEGLFQKRPTCVNVEPVPPGLKTNWVQITVYHYRTFLVTGHAKLYAYYTDQRGNRLIHAKGCPKLK